MKQVTRRQRRKQYRARQWAEIVALAQAGMPRAQIARQCGCCRQTVYNVLVRARGLPVGLAPVPQAPGPAPGTGRQVPPKLVRQLCEWRRSSWRGARYCRAQLGLSLSATTIARIWRRAGLLGPRQLSERPRTRWVPPRPQAPGHLQADVKYLPGGRFEYTAIDLYTRFVWADVRERLDSATAADFLRHVLATAPFTIHTVQSDNGSEFGLEFTALLKQHRINHQRNAPRCAWQNGSVERFHRTVAEECYLALHGELARISTTRLNRSLARWLSFYNERRLHSALNYRPPIRALLCWQNQVSN